MKLIPFVSNFKLIVIVFLIFFIPACGNQEAPYLDIQPTGTYTPLSPTPTFPTYTSAPILQELGNILVFPEDTINPIDLESILVFSEAPVEELTWTISETLNLSTAVADGILHITPITAEWRGTEMLTIEVCNPSGLCDRDEIRYSVVDTSYPVVIHVGNCGFIVMADGKKVAIDTEECLGCESCVELCPEVFEMDEEEEKAIVILQEGGDEACIEEAIETCPAECIFWD